jgi:hypothetical protein
MNTQLPVVVDLLVSRSPPNQNLNMPPSSVDDHYNRRLLDVSTSSLLLTAFGPVPLVPTTGMSSFLLLFLLDLLTTLLSPILSEHFNSYCVLEVETALPSPVPDPSGSSCSPEMPLRRSWLSPSVAAYIFSTSTMSTDSSRLSFLSLLR